MRAFWIGALAALLIAASGCDGDDDSGAPSGIETEHGGKALGAWMKQYFTWQLGGAAAGGRDSDLVYLAMPNGTDPDGDHVLSGEVDQSLASTDGFVLPMFVWVGETYQGGAPADDDPSTPPDAAFTGSAMRVVVTLDGATILDSTHDDLAQYFFSAQRFDSTITYAMPSDYGMGVLAVGAIWVKGIGILHAPLSTGSHTVHLEEFNSEANVGFSNTWHITVH